MCIVTLHTNPYKIGTISKKKLCKCGLFMLKERFELLKFLYFSFRNLQTMLWFTLSLSFLCILSTRLILLRFCFLGKLTYLLFIYNRKLSPLFTSTEFIVVSLHNLNTKQHQHCQRELQCTKL